MLNNVLVLNSNYQPLATCSWKQAVILIFKEVVEVVENYDKPIRSPSFSMPMPAVIRLKEYIPLQYVRVGFSKRAIYERDKGKCGYCLEDLSFNEATIDHITPQYLGGKTTFRNCCLACYRCNQDKSNLTLEQAGMSLKLTPFTPRPMPMASALLSKLRHGKVPKEWHNWVRL